MAITLTQLNSQNVETRYKNYDKRVISFIKLIIQDLEFSYKKLPSSFIATFDLMADALKIYYMAADMIDTVKTPNELSKVKNAMLQSSNYVNKLASTFGASPVDKARIKRLNQHVDDSDELLEDLIS